MKNNPLSEFVQSSYLLLQGHSQSGRYFHDLTSSDNSPLVVHHNTNQLTYVLKGSGKAFISGKERYINEGAVLFIPAGITHRFVADQKMTLFHIHIPDSGRENDREIVEGDDYDRFVPE